MRRVEDGLLSELPDERAHRKYAPMNRSSRAAALAQQTQPKLSAVLVAVFPNAAGNACTVLMQRNAYEGVHSAQISFPGGKQEPSDIDLVDTALREAEEEVGIPRNGLKVQGPLSDVYIPPSGFLVTPYLATTQEHPTWVPDPREVQQIIELPLADLVAPNASREHAIELSNGMVIRAPGFKVQKHIVWGATAMMLGELREILCL